MLLKSCGCFWQKQEFYFSMRLHRFQHNLKSHKFRNTWLKLQITNFLFKGREKKNISFKSSSRWDAPKRKTTSSPLLFLKTWNNPSTCYVKKLLRLKEYFLLSLFPVIFLRGCFYIWIKSNNREMHFLCSFLVKWVKTGILLLPVL